MSADPALRRIFVSEAVCGGAFAGSIEGSLAVEGFAMLAAVVEDFHTAGHQVGTTLDRRLPKEWIARIAKSAEVDLCDSPPSEQQAFERFSKSADRVLIIAPETDDELARRINRAIKLGAVVLNCHPSAVRLCGDKAALAEFLSLHNVATIPTIIANEDVPWPFPLLLKPRDGAGCLNTVRIETEAELHSQLKGLTDADRFILQPWIFGRHCSVAAVISGGGELVEIFPPAAQIMDVDGHAGLVSADSREERSLTLPGAQTALDARTDGNGRSAGLVYRGGRIPLRDADSRAIEALVRKACTAIDGLSGYVGFDLILPDDQPGEPVLVEINPRLTTSYLGYRELAVSGLVKGLLWGRPVRWRAGTIEFVIESDRVRLLRAFE